MGSEADRQASKKHGPYKREGIESIGMSEVKPENIIKARMKLHNLEQAGKLNDTQLKALDNLKGIRAKSLTEGQARQILSILHEAQQENSTGRADREDNE